VCRAAQAGAQVGSIATQRRAPRPSPVTAALLAALQDSCGPPLTACPLSAPPHAPAAPGPARDMPRRGARAYVRPAEAAVARAVLPPSPFNTPYLLALPLPGGAAKDRPCVWQAGDRICDCEAYSEALCTSCYGHRLCLHARSPLHTSLAMPTVKPSGMGGPLAAYPHSASAGTTRPYPYVEPVQFAWAPTHMRTAKNMRTSPSRFAPTS